MKRSLIAALGLAVTITSCVTYTGVSKSSDGELYISGGTNYFVYSTPWVRRCKVDDTKLDCVELSESPKPAAGAAGAAGGTAAPASSAEPAAPATSDPPASAPDSSGANK